MAKRSSKKSEAAPAGQSDAAKSSDRKPSTAKSSPAKTSTAKYTKPQLREQIKKKVVRGSKGGRPGQWSARKAQLVTQGYEKAGGTYRGDRSESQKSLKNWSEEHWTTADGKPAKRGNTMARYLPEKAWDQLLSDAEKKSTDTKKRAASRHGKLFVPNTKPAAKARRAAKKN